MACIDIINKNNYIVWNKVSGTLTLAELQANGVPDYCDSINSVPLEAPVLSVTDVLVDQIDLEWTASSGAISYVLERNIEGAGWTEIATPSAETLTYEDITFDD